MIHFVKIGEIKVTGEATTLKTVVGSCIALCMYDKSRSMGGMAHIMLPDVNGDLKASPGKYANTAVQTLLTIMERRRSESQDITASAFGGAAMFEISLTGSDQAIGIMNFQMVREQLKKFGIPMIKKEIGGQSGRRIVFDCKTGKISVSTLGVI